MYFLEKYPHVQYLHSFSTTSSSFFLYCLFSLLPNCRSPPNYDNCAWTLFSPSLKTLYPDWTRAALFCCHVRFFWVAVTSLATLVYVGQERPAGSRSRSCNETLHSIFPLQIKRTSTKSFPQRCRCLLYWTALTETRL